MFDTFNFSYTNIIIEKIFNACSENMRATVLVNPYPYENEKWGCPWAAHVLHMGYPLKQWAAQWTGAAHFLCKLNICPWAAYGQLSGQELPTNFQSLNDI